MYKSYLLALLATSVPFLAIDSQQVNAEQVMRQRANTLAPTRPSTIAGSDFSSVGNYGQGSQSDVTFSAKRERRKTVILAETPDKSLALTPLSGKFAVVAKTCSRDVSLSQSRELLQLAEESSDKCLTPPQQSVVLPSSEVLGKINQKVIGLETRLKVSDQQLSDIDRDMVDTITDYLSRNKDNPQISQKDFFPNIDPEVIRFMFTLSNLSYYDKNFSANENNRSTNYQKAINQLEATVNSLRGKQQKISAFKKQMNDTFGSNTIARLQKRRLEINLQSDKEQQEASVSKGIYGQEFGIGLNIGQGGQSFNQNQGGNTYSSGQSRGAGTETTQQQQSEISDLEIRSLAPELVRAIAQQFNALFKDDPLTITDQITLSDVEERVNKIDLQARNDLVDAEQSLKILSDQRVADFWVKLDSTFNKLAEGFKPIDVLYRNMSKYKAPLIGSGVAEAKKNELTNLGNKELSGILMFKPDESGSPQKTDQLIISFSGSNSTEDWKHNFDGLTTEGLASSNLVVGLKGHRGIMASLDESIQESGPKLRFWFDKYVEPYTANAANKPTLKIYVTGHSLGGALATMMSVWVKQNIVERYSNRVNIEIIVYTFGAPPVFEKKSADRVEAMLGKHNIIRVWNIGDPVSTLSILKKTEEVFQRSPLMVLLGYKHVGMSVPLADNEKMASFFDKFNPWSNHLSDRYNNLIQTNWKEIINHRANLVYNFLRDNNLIEAEKLRQALKDIDQFIRTPTVAPAVLINNFSANEIVGIIQQPDQPTNAEMLMKNYEQIVESRYSQGETATPKFTKAETGDLNYVHRLLTGQKVNMSIHRNTSCDISNIAKISGLNTRTLNPSDGNELSCGCCLTKNYFVSLDNSIAGKFRQLFGKKISTAQEVFNHCSKYCSPLIGTVFPNKKDVDVKSIGEFMDRLGLKQSWENKKLQ